MATPTVAPRPRRGPTQALAHVNLVGLAQEMRAELSARQCTRADTGPFALATWSSWLTLLGYPSLRLQEGFPVTCAWVRSLLEHTTIMIGAMILNEPNYLLERLTEDLRADAANQRANILAELNQLPCWMEAKVEKLPPEVRSDMEKMLNTVSELFFEMGEILGELAIKAVAARSAETLLRCRFRRDNRNGVNNQPLSPRPSTSPDLLHSASHSSPPGFPMTATYESSEEMFVIDDEPETGGTGINRHDHGGYGP